MEREKHLKRKLKQKTALRCTCKHKAQSGKHALFSTQKAHDEKCLLFATQLGIRKWAGQNVGVTEDDLDFLDQRELLAKRQKRQ